MAMTEDEAREALLEENRALLKAQVAKEEAETKRIGLEAARLEQEYARLRSETFKLDKEGSLAALAYEKSRRADDEDLLSNKYHHVYAFTTSVSKESVESCIRQLTAWMRQDPMCDIEIIFNSPGGSIIDGMALYDFIQTVRFSGHKVTTVALGMAASMAGILLQAGDVRVIGKESYLLIHEASFGAVGKIGEVEDTVEFVKKVQRRVLKIFAARSNLTVRQLERRWKRKDWWLDSDDCMTHKLVDEVR